MSPKRRDLFRWLVASGTVLAIGNFPLYAWSKPKPKTTIHWTNVEFPEDKLRTQRERILRTILRKESSTEDWGPHNQRIEASIRIIEYQIVHTPEVVRVTCTAVGKLVGGPSVRTHFSIGDHPTKQAKLERNMMTFVARGIVTRLAVIARNRAAAKAKNDDA